MDEIASPKPSEAINQPQLQYTASWKVLYKGREKGCIVRDFTVVGNSSSSGDAYVDARVYAERVAENLSEGLWNITRIKAIAYYGLRKLSKHELDVLTKLEYEAIVDKAFAWQRREETAIRIDLEIHIEKELPLANRLESPAIQQTLAPSQRARNSAIARQLQQAAETTLEGDNSALLRARWTCLQAACSNNYKGGYCYWNSSDSSDNYFPITKEVVADWSRDIKDNRLTIEEPSVSIITMLMKARERLRSQSYSHKKASKSAAEPAGQSMIQQFFGYGFEQLPGAAIAAKRSPTPIAKPPSSQPSITTPLELIEQFFNHCLLQHRWLGLQDDIDTIRTTLINEGFNIQGIERVSKEDWQSMDLKRGQFEKLKESLRKWKIARRATG